VFLAFFCNERSQSRLTITACVTLAAVELKEQPLAPMLAHKLGDVPDVPEIQGLFRDSQPKVLALISTRIP
jgi:hypothetical protein